MDQLCGLWDQATSLTLDLKIPAEAAGPLFVAMMQFRRHVNKFLRHQEIVLIHAAVSIIAPYICGFQYTHDDDYDSERIGLTDELHVIGQMFQRRWSAVVTEKPMVPQIRMGWVLALVTVTPLGI